MVVEKKNVLGVYWGCKIVYMYDWIEAVMKAKVISTKERRKETIWDYLANQKSLF